MAAIKAESTEPADGGGSVHSVVESELAIGSGLFGAVGTEQFCCCTVGGGQALAPCVVDPREDVARAVIDVRTIGEVHHAVALLIDQTGAQREGVGDLLGDEVLEAIF